MTLQELATALGGHVSGGGVVAPGPGHGAKDRSLSVTPAKNSNGFVCFSFAGDDPQMCIAHVKSLTDPEKRAALAALAGDSPARDLERAEDDPVAPGWFGRWKRRKTEVEPRALDERRRRIEPALEIWNAAVSPIRTLVEVYLWRARHLDLPPDLAGEVVRFHPACPWRDDEQAKKSFRAPCMIVAVRDFRTDEIVGIQRTRLTIDGQKIDRRYTGITKGAAIKVDPGDTEGLHIAEGLETALAARTFGLQPVWALGSAGAIAAFPVLAGIECLSILVELDSGASDKASAECAERWHAAGREVITIAPKIGKDMNDLV